MVRHLGWVYLRNFKGGGFPDWFREVWWLSGKESACGAGDPGSIPGGRSPGIGRGNTLQYLCLENSVDRGALWAIAHGSQRVRHDWATNNTFLTEAIYIIESMCFLLGSKLWFLKHFLNNKCYWNIGCSSISISKIVF